MEKTIIYIVYKVDEDGKDLDGVAVFTEYTKAKEYAILKGGWYIWEKVLDIPN